MSMSEKVADPHSDVDTSQDVAAPTHSPDAARREVIKRLGVYGAFITPALLTALTSTASAQVVVESGSTN